MGTKKNTLWVVLLKKMETSLSLTPLCSLKIPNQPGLFVGLPSTGIGKAFRVHEIIQSSRAIRFQSLEVKAAAGSNNDEKYKSLICTDCDGNGAVQCSQCKGGGVNIVDHFNGQVKAGATCWLCGGRKEMLCGNCNGAGFIGGFLSTKDE